MPHVCPWWGGYFIDNPLHRLFHNPENILGPHSKMAETQFEGMKTVHDFRKEYIHATIVLLRHCRPSRFCGTPLATFDDGSGVLVSRLVEDPEPDGLD